MKKLQIYSLNSDDYYISLNCQMQQQVQGGFDREIYETLKENRDYSSIAYGDVAPNAFAFNILIDRGEDNQISQTLST